jgi:cell division protein FtsB
LVLLWWSNVPSLSSPAGHRRRNAGSPVARTKQILRILFLFGIALLIGDALVGDRGLLALLRAQRQYDALAAMIARQRAENALLRETARRLAEDPTAIEEVARRELGLIKPGEKVFIIRGLTSTPGQGRPAAPPAPDRR